MKIGFTGTRNGMTSEQHTTVECLLVTIFLPTEMHHGDCIGADADFHRKAKIMVNPDQIFIHPPEKSDLRAMCWEEGNLLCPPKGCFARNRDIVDDTDGLIACPPAMVELTDGGTWYTINYAKKKGKPVAIVWPDGTWTKV